MKPEQNVIGILFEKYQKQGYVTQNDIFDLCEEYDLSFIQTDYVGNQLLEKGVLISDTPVTISNNSKELKEVQKADTEEQEFFDYAQVNYDEIYQYFLTNYPQMKYIIEYAKAVPPVQNGEIRRLITQIRSGNKFARDLLIQKYIRYALKFALYYKDKTTIPLSDIFSEAMLAVIKAVDAYNPYENSYFSSYAAAAIRQNIDRYICNFERIIRIPVHMMEKINTANDLKTSYPNLEPEEIIILIAKKLGISITEAENIYDLSKPKQPIPLEELIEDENSENSIYKPIYIQNSVEELAEQSTLKEDIAKAMRTLSEREKQVLSLRYGLEDEKIRTLEEVGTILNVTRERIRQIEVKALRKLKHPSRSQYISQYSSKAQKSASKKKSQKSNKVKRTKVIHKSGENNVTNSVEAENVRVKEADVTEYLEFVKTENSIETKRFINQQKTVSKKKSPKSNKIKRAEEFHKSGKNNVTNSVEAENIRIKETNVTEYLEVINTENFIETKRFIISQLENSAINKKIAASELFDAMDKYNLDILQYSEIYDSIVMQGYAIVSDEEYQQEKGV